MTGWHVVIGARPRGAARRPRPSDSGTRASLIPRPAAVVNVAARGLRYGLEQCVRSAYNHYLLIKSILREGEGGKGRPSQQASFIVDASLQVVRLRHVEPDPCGQAMYAAWSM